MFQEFPKMLFKGDAHSIVDDAAQETELRADGWHDFGAEPTQAAEGDALKVEVAPKAPRAKKHAEPTQAAED